ncbi:MAG: IclR family transcriptional regulator [Acidimicrobiia bacterium]
MDSVSGVGVLDKSVAILAALADEPRSLAELVTTTGMPRPTAHRLATALEDHDLVGRDAAGRFRLGPRLLQWGARARTAVGLATVAQPVLDALRDETGESAQLFVREGDRRVCVAAAERPSGLRDTVPVGASLPMHLGSAAKVLRAWSGDGDPELAVTRRRGWGASVGEREAGVASVSAPVLDATRAAVAAIGVSGPIERLGRRPGRRYSRAVTAAARRLELLAGLTVHPRETRP